MTKKRAFPVCEVCKKNESMSFSWFQHEKRLLRREEPCSPMLGEKAPTLSSFDFDNMKKFDGQGIFKKGVWKLCCHCTDNTESYYVTFRDFFQSNDETVDWICHLGDKCWFDFQDFSDCLRRFLGQDPDGFYGDPNWEMELLEEEV